jgi:hypothetical protein
MQEGMNPGGENGNQEPSRCRDESDRRREPDARSDRQAGIAILTTNPMTRQSDGGIRHTGRGFAADVRSG